MWRPVTVTAIGKDILGVGFVWASNTSSFDPDGDRGMTYWKERIQRIAVRSFWSVAVLIAVFVTIGFVLSPIFVFFSGGVADRFLAVAGLLLILLFPRRSASETYEKWHERAVFAVLTVLGCKLAWWAWKSFTRDERALLGTIGVLGGAIMVFGVLRVTVSRWMATWREHREWRSYEKDPNRAGRDAYAKWLKEWDETSGIEQPEVRPERNNEQL
jgi:hypothetical protein